MFNEKLLRKSIRRETQKNQLRVIKKDTAAKLVRRKKAAITSLQPAGFSRRFLATCADTLMLIFLTKVLSLSKLLPTQTESSLAIASLGLLILLPMALFSTTLGKTIFGIKVLNLKNNDNIGLFKAIFREIFGKAISLIFFGLGYINLFFNSEKLTWHDRLLQTRVVRTKNFKT